jgi:hypothetical protein
MALYWRVKTWEIKINGDLNIIEDSVYGINKVTYLGDSFVEMISLPSINSEEDYVCGSGGVEPLSVSPLQANYHYYDPPLDRIFSYTQGFSLVFSAGYPYEYNLLTDGSNYYLFFGLFISPAVSSNYAPTYNVNVGSYSISFNGYTKTGNLYSVGGFASSGNILCEIKAKEYWSYGGTYDTTTGNPL